MTYRFLFTLAALPAVIACGDDAQKEHTPTAPAAAVAPSLQRVSGPSALSAVCRVYKQEREVAQRQLADTPDDAALQKQVQAYDGPIADVCN
jgi:hypothetical protein